MKITDRSPARAACAATAVARLPVEAHETVVDGVVLDIKLLEPELRAEPARMQ
jgi:hypothetical protein